MVDFSEVQRRITDRFSVEELESRLRPQKPGSGDGGWSDHSSGGFLAPNERLMEVVRTDYDALTSLEKSYGEMAQVASNILEQASIECYGGVLRKSIARYWKPVANIDRDRYKLMRSESHGFQRCPWECNVDEYGYRTLGSGHVHVMEKGKEEPDLMQRFSNGRRKILMDREMSRKERDEKLREFERSLGVEFGGMNRVLYLSAFTVVTDLTPHLIASHCFFEGDASYRTDPRKLLQVAGIE